VVEKYVVSEHHVAQHIMLCLLNENKSKKECVLVLLQQGFPTSLLPSTPSAFRQRRMYPSAFRKISMHPFSISTDEYVPLKFVMTNFFVMINRRYI